MRARALWIFAVAFLAWPCAVSQAAGDTTKCLVLVQRVDLKSKSGDWIPLTTEPHEIDLAADNPSIRIAKPTLPAGPYVGCKLTLSETLKAAGSDLENQTKPGGVIRLSGNAHTIEDVPPEITAIEESAPTWNTSEEGLITETIDFDFLDRDNVMEIYTKREFKEPLIVNEKTVVTVFLRVDMKKTMNYVWPNFFEKFPDRDVMYFIPPKSVNELSVQAGSTVQVATDHIVWDY